MKQANKQTNPKQKQFIKNNKIMFCVLVTKEMLFLTATDVVRSF